MRHTKTTLYRCFDASGCLLYVGISLNISRRFPQHEIDKSWWAEVSRITLEHYPTRRTALEAELAACKAELPLHNQSGHPLKAVVSNFPKAAIPLLETHLGTRQVAEKLCTTKKAIEKLRYDPKGPPYIKLGGRYFYPVAALESWIHDQHSDSLQEKSHERKTRHQVRSFLLRP